MLTIYGVLRSRASRNHRLANELGLAVRSVPVALLHKSEEGFIL